MSVDDQLFKEDGTVLTRVDNLLLKFAQVFASALFAEDDDETFDRALRRILRVAAILATVTSFTYAIGIDLFVALIFLLPAGLYWLGSLFSTCNGRGCTVTRAVKFWNLFFLLFPLVFLVSNISLVVIKGANMQLVGAMVWDLAFWHYNIGVGYVQRLQNKPPKRKRARAFKLGFLPTQ
jgi:hypothetical protein